jgi:hypothetical protein
MWGGRDLTSTTFFHDMWMFDYGSNSWYLINTTIPTNHVFGFGYCYDKNRDWIIQYGGGEGNGVVGSDLWAYVISNNTWISLPSGADARFLPAMQYDSARDGYIVSGGGTFNMATIYPNCYIFYPVNNSWVYYGSTQPIQRLGQNMVYTNISIAGHPMIFNGRLSSGSYTNQLEVFDRQNDVWHAISTTNAPAPCFEAGMAMGDNYQLYQFGGQTDTFYFGTLYLCNVSILIWSPLGSLSIVPSPRSGIALVYVPSHQTLLLFSGNGTFPDNALWEFSLITLQWRVVNGNPSYATTSTSSTTTISSSTQTTNTQSNNTQTNTSNTQKENSTSSPFGEISGYPVELLIVCIIIWMGIYIKRTDLKKISPR